MKKRVLIRFLQPRDGESKHDDCLSAPIEQLIQLVREPELSIQYDTPLGLFELKYLPPDPV